MIPLITNIIENERRRFSDLPPRAAIAPSKNPLETVSSGQLDSCWVMGTGGCNRDAFGYRSGTRSFSPKDSLSSSASSSRPWVAAVR